MPDKNTGKLCYNMAHATIQFIPIIPIYLYNTHTYI